MYQVGFNVQMLSSLIHFNSKHTVQNRKLFSSESANPSVPISFAVFSDLKIHVFESISV